MIFTAAAVIKMFREEIHRAFMNQAQIPPTVRFSFSEKPNPSGPGLEEAGCFLWRCSAVRRVSCRPSGASAH